MMLTDRYNETISRETSRLSPAQAGRMVDAMEQFDDLVRLGLVQPEPYKVETVGALGLVRTSNVPLRA